MSENFRSLPSDFTFVIRLYPRLVNGVQRNGDTFEIESRSRKTVDVHMMKANGSSLATFLDTIHDAIQQKKKRSYFVRLVDTENKSVAFSTTAAIQNALYVASLQVMEGQVPQIELYCFLFSRTMSIKLHPFLTSREEKNILEAFLRYGSYVQAGQPDGAHDGALGDGALYDAGGVPSFLDAAPKVSIVYKMDGEQRTQFHPALLEGEGMAAVGRVGDAPAARLVPLSVRKDIFEDVKTFATILQLRRDDPQSPMLMAFSCPVCKPSRDPMPHLQAPALAGNAIPAPPIPAPPLAPTEVPRHFPRAEAGAM